VAQVNEDVVATGALSPGRFAFRPATMRFDGQPDTVSYLFDGVTAEGVELDLDEVRVHISGSRFEACTFRQDQDLAEANRKKFAYSHSYVLLGMRDRSTYHNCIFDHVDFGLAGGGARPGDARFERCTFIYCTFRNFNADKADFVDCIFLGTVSSARFSASPLLLTEERQSNVFSGNDLSRAKLRRVEFRGIDLRSSRLPEGPEYLRVDDFLAKAQQVRSMLAGWPDVEREQAQRLLSLYEERWCEPLFQWRKALAGRGSPLWPLLESVSPLP
jgi:hypothetical protein